MKRIKTKEGRAALATLVGCAVLLAVMEVGTRTRLARFSRVQARIARETEEVNALRKVPGKTVVLAMGNSLMLGFDTQTVQDELGPDFIVKRCAFEFTMAIEWNYWIRRLAVEGTRADILLVGARPRMMDTFSSMRPPMFTHFMVHRSHLPKVIGFHPMHPTEAVRMVFVAFSRFMAVREHLNKFAVGALVPDFEALATQMRAYASETEVMTEKAMDFGVSDLADAAKGLDARLVLWVPPSFGQPASVLDPLTSAASKLGVPVLIPVADSALERGAYTDDQHLTEEAGREVSRALARSIRSTTRGR